MLRYVVADVNGTLYTMTNQDRCDMYSDTVHV